MDVPSAKLLLEVVRRESLSLLTYVGDAFPWTAKSGDTALAQLRQIVAEHKQAVAALGRLLARWHVPLGFTGSYPSEFTAINFLSLNYILTRLVESESRSLATLEAEMFKVTDTEVHTALEHLLTMKRDHLARLKSLVSSFTISQTSAAS